MEPASIWEAQKDWVVVAVVANRKFPSALQAADPAVAAAAVPKVDDSDQIPVVRVGEQLTDESPPAVRVTRETPAGAHPEAELTAGPSVHQQRAPVRDDRSMHLPRRVYRKSLSSRRRHPNQCPSSWSTHCCSKTKETSLERSVSGPMPAEPAACRAKRARACLAPRAVAWVPAERARLEYPPTVAAEGEPQTESDPLLYRAASAARNPARVGERRALMRRAAARRRRTSVVAGAAGHRRMLAPHAHFRRASRAPMSQLEPPKVKENHRVPKTHLVSTAVSRWLRLLEVEVAVIPEASFAELAAAPLCSSAVRVANWEAVVEGVPHQTPREQVQALQKKTSSTEAHRRRPDPIRPCHS